MKKHTVFPIIGIVFGVVIIILGLCTLGMGSFVDHASFGGDFYTYSYRATRYAANNIFKLTKAVGCLTISFGLFDIAYFGCKLFEKKAELEAKAASTPVDIVKDIEANLPDM